MPNENTIAPKDFAQETSSAKMRTAKAIIWNTGEELKQVSVSALVNNNVTKDAVPTEGSANPITSGGVWDFTYSKANIDGIVTVINSAKANKSEVYTREQVNVLLSHKENIATEESFADNTSITLADNTIYTASEPISTLSLEAQASGTSVVSFDTASSGAITIYLPSSIKFTELPTFGNNEHWEIAVRKGYGVYTKYNLV